MATFVLGGLLLVAFYFAVRHVYRNFRDGKEDCCGSSSCHACSGCQSSPTKK